MVRKAQAESCLLSSSSSQTDMKVLHKPTWLLASCRLRFNGCRLDQLIDAATLCGNLLYMSSVLSDVW